MLQESKAEFFPFSSVSVAEICKLSTDEVKCSQIELVHNMVKPFQEDARLIAEVQWDQDHVTIVCQESQLEHLAVRDWQSRCVHFSCPAEYLLQRRAIQLYPAREVGQALLVWDGLWPFGSIGEEPDETVAVQIRNHGAKSIFHVQLHHLEHSTAIASRKLGLFVEQTIVHLNKFIGL